MADDTKADGPSADSEAESPALPQIDFSTFVLSLSTSALYEMGLVGGPDGDRLTEPNLILARQTIDTVEMLREKTRGNLSDDESKLLDSLVYELRMRFVSTSPEGE